MEEINNNGIATTNPNEGNNGNALVTLKGSVDYNTYIAQLSDEQKQAYLAMAESVNIEDKTSLQVYGSEINGTISQASENLLTTVRSNNNDEIVGYVNDTLAQLNLIDIDDLDPNNKFRNWMRTVPVLRTLVKTVDSVMMKYDTIQENVDKIAKKIDGAKVTAKRDNSTLEAMMKNNDTSIERIKELIVALKLKLEEFKEQLKNMEDSNANSWEIQNMSNFINAIGKKIADLEMTERILSNNQYQIMAAQSNNDAIIDKCENIITHVLPIWKNELSLAIIINKQKASIDATKKISDATNKMMKATAKNVRLNSEEAARASEETVVKLETLKDTNKELVEMLREVRKIHQDGVRQREALDRSLVDMSNQVSKEIKSIEAK